MQWLLVVPIVVRSFAPAVPVYDNQGEIVPEAYWPPRFTFLAPQSAKAIEVDIDWLDATGALRSHVRAQANNLNANEWAATWSDEDTPLTLTDKRDVKMPRFRLKFFVDGAPAEFQVDKGAEWPLPSLRLTPPPKIAGYDAHTAPPPPPTPYPHEDDLMAYAAWLTPAPPLIPIANGESVSARVRYCCVLNHPDPVKTLDAQTARALVDVLNDPTTYGGAACFCHVTDITFEIAVGKRRYAIVYERQTRYIADGDNFRVVSKRGARRLAPFCK